MKKSLLAAIALLGALSACGGGRGAPAAPPLPEPLASRPLADMAARPMMVLPTQYLRPDTIGWSQSIGDDRQFLRTVDDEIAFSLGERVGRQWSFARDVERMARRNATYAPDPYRLGAEVLRPGMRRRADQLAEPLASQLRTLTAMHEARYVLLPVEVRFERAAEGMGRAVLHIALIDTRLNRVAWTSDVRGDATASLTPAAAASVAVRLADLVANAP
ncbi:MAG: hypothetical protein H0X64_12920 [Gemmatimonadaceae bacterium]|nr:hypothetical protein [Gemmatimonadaceae bacterium]